MRCRQSKSSLWGIIRLLIVPAIIISVFMLIWLKSEITSLEYRISEYESERLDLLKQKKTLIVRRSDILSIKNIEYVAMNRFGLSFPDRKKVIYVKRGESPFNVRAGMHLKGE
jgi:hypothetical protein